MKKICITLRDSGDPSVGLFPWEDIIEIHIKNTLISDHESLQNFIDYMKECLEGYYECKAFSEEDLANEQKAYDEMKEDWQK